MNLQSKIAEGLAQGKDLVDLKGRLSYGKGTGTQNLLDEHAKAIQLSWTISNTTTVMKTIAISPFFDTLKNTTQYNTVAELLTAVKADHALTEGDIVRVDADHALVANSTNSEQPLKHFLRYIASNPTRIVGLAMRSANATTGQPERSNYDLTIRSYYVSPFELPVKKELNLRPLVPTGLNFNSDCLNLNFILQNFHALLSPENILTLQIQPNTTLTMTVYVGAQYSRSQEFYRIIKDADNVLRPELAKVS